MFKSQDGIGEFGQAVPGPPWILGHRGAPREAPENTLVGLRRAIELGLDGVEYDVHACATGEALLIHDETLERTTNGHGLVSDLSLLEASTLDAGGWFKRSFAGEPLPLLEEALELSGNQAGTWPQHMIELKVPQLVHEVARQLSALRRPMSVRLASFSREVCLEARDAGLVPMLLAVEAGESDRRFVRDERIAAYGTAPKGWLTEAGQGEWECERWCWALDEPEDLLDACRAPLNGFNTNDPLRALATRALVRLTPHDRGPYPVRAPLLEVPVAADTQSPSIQGEWVGDWDFDLRVRNPFPFPVELALALAVRGGAFQVGGLPAQLDLEVGAEAAVPVKLAGGSWAPAEDPIVHARFVWAPGPGRPRESLRLECPLHRVRSVRAGAEALRVPMLREHPGQRGASMGLRLAGNQLLAWVEDAGGLEDLRCIVRLGSHVRHGGQGVRVPLPQPLLGEGSGAQRQLEFGLGFEGRLPGQGPRLLRRFAGGLPYGLGSGAPGRLWIGDRS